MGDYTLETKDQPVRAVVFSTWRSGSTFIGKIISSCLQYIPKNCNFTGDLLNSMPGNFYHYEPLLNYGIVQVRGPPYADGAILTLKNLLNCNYTDLHGSVMHFQI